MNLEWPTTWVFRGFRDFSAELRDSHAKKDSWSPEVIQKWWKHMYHIRINRLQPACQKILNHSYSYQLWKEHLETWSTYVIILITFPKPNGKSTWKGYSIHSPYSNTIQHSAFLFCFVFLSDYWFCNIINHKLPLSHLSSTCLPPHFCLSTFNLWHTLVCYTDHYIKVSDVNFEQKQK